MKPTLLMLAGHGWSATSPLYYTLAHNHRYCHGGHFKENKYLEHIYYYNQRDEDLLNIKRIRFRQLFNGVKRDQADGSKAMRFGDRERPPTVMSTSEYNDHWDKNFVNDFFSLPHTFEKYIQYYKTHWEAIKDTYSAVSDCTVNNIYMPEKYVREIAAALKPHFRVKVLIIYRDPVQRAWSHLQFRWFQKGITRDCVDPYHMFWQTLMNHQEKKDLYDMDIISLYTEGLRRWSGAFGAQNVHNIIMEDLWSDDTKSLRDLSNFLSYDVTDLFPNCYVPEKGSQAPHLEYLSDQWMSNQVDLSEEQLNTARALMHKAYTNFQEVFGYIPEQWTKLQSVEVPNLICEDDYNLEEIYRKDPLSRPQKL